MAKDQKKVLTEREREVLHQAAQKINEAGELLKSANLTNTMFMRDPVAVDTLKGMLTYDGFVTVLTFIK